MNSSMSDSSGETKFIAEDIKSGTEAGHAQLNLSNLAAPEAPKEPKKLTYSDFYEQLKSTGFGDTLLAAQYLSKRFGFAFSDQNLQRFVTVVKNVRQEILRQNPNNKLVGREFELRCDRWLKSVAFTENDLAEVAAEEDCAVVKEKAPTDVREVKWYEEEELRSRAGIEQEKLLQEREDRMREREMKEREQELRRKEREKKKLDKERELRLTLEKELKERSKADKREEMAEKRRLKKEESEKQKMLKQEQLRLKRERRMEEQRKEKEARKAAKLEKRMRREAAEREAKELRRQAKAVKKQRLEEEKKARMEIRRRKREADREMDIEKEIRREVRRKEAEDRKEREKAEGPRTRRKAGQVTKEAKSGGTPTSTPSQTGAGDAGANLSDSLLMTVEGDDEDEDDEDEEVDVEEDEVDVEEDEDDDDYFDDDDYDEDESLAEDEFDITADVEGVFLAAHSVGIDFDELQMSSFSEWGAPKADGKQAPQSKKGADLPVEVDEKPVNATPSLSEILSCQNGDETQPPAETLPPAENLPLAEHDQSKIHSESDQPATSTSKDAPEAICSSDLISADDNAYAPSSDSPPMKLMENLDVDPPHPVQ